MSKIMSKLATYELRYCANAVLFVQHHRYFTDDPFQEEVKEEVRKKFSSMIIKELIIAGVVEERDLSDEEMERRIKEHEKNETDSPNPQ